MQQNRRTVSVDELLDKAAEKKFQQEKSENRELLDLKSAYWYIQFWKKSFFRKNAAKTATIRVLSHSVLVDSLIQFYNYIQLFVAGKCEQSLPLRAEAFDVLMRDIPEEILESNKSIYTLHKVVK